MKNSKENILLKSLQLFNEYGVSNVSVRQIASELQMSHSNLIYHFNSKNLIIEALHQQILDKAIAINNQVKKSENLIQSLFESTKLGFNIALEYRFFFLDLNFIMRENPNLKSTFLEVEKIRATMYKNIIEIAIQNGIMRPELFDNEYDYFIHHVKIFSDFWISSSAIYDVIGDDLLVLKYSDLFTKLFFPFLTEKGKEDFFTFSSKSQC
jgi:AcrR family transcriptional regulator